LFLVATLIFGPMKGFDQIANFFASAIRTAPQSFFAVCCFVGVPTMVLICVAEAKHINDLSYYIRWSCLILISITMIVAFFAYMHPAVFVTAGLVVGFPLGIVFSYTYWAIAGRNAGLRQTPAV
jgi:hypothetical protein